MVGSNGRPLALVTGASKGIGMELAREFASRRFDLVIAAEHDDIERAASELRAEGAEVTPVQVDLATFEGVEELASSAAMTGRPLDAVAINAGVGVGGRFAETDLDAQLRLIELNITGAVHLARRVLPAIIARGEGGLLFTSSIAATMPGTYEATYAASKAFLYSFAQALRKELEDTGVRITALMPGPTDTNFFQRAGLEDTRLGHAKRDDPETVAREGVAAFLEGKDRVVTGALRNKLQVAAAKVLPDKAVARMHGVIAKPGSAR